MQNCKIFFVSSDDCTVSNLLSSAYHNLLNCMYFMHACHVYIGDILEFYASVICICYFCLLASLFLPKCGV